jgi:hypothetical protein
LLSAERSSRNCKIVPLDEHLSRSCPEFCGATRTSDVIDASVVILARQHGNTIDERPGRPPTTRSKGVDRSDLMGSALPETGPDGWLLPSESLSMPIAIDNIMAQSRGSY